MCIKHKLHKVIRTKVRNVTIGLFYFSFLVEMHEKSHAFPLKRKKRGFE
jgi:hypothetical protein